MITIMAIGWYFFYTQHRYDKQWKRLAAALVLAYATALLLGLVLVELGY